MQQQANSQAIQQAKNFAEPSHNTRFGTLAGYHFDNSDRLSLAKTFMSALARGETPALDRLFQPMLHPYDNHYNDNEVKNLATDFGESRLYPPSRSCRQHNAAASAVPYSPQWEQMLLGESNVTNSIDSFDQEKAEICSAEKRLFMAEAQYSHCDVDACVDFILSNNEAMQEICDDDNITSALLCQNSVGGATPPAGADSGTIPNHHSVCPSFNNESERRNIAPLHNYVAENSMTEMGTQPPSSPANTIPSRGSLEELETLLPGNNIALPGSVFIDSTLILVSPSDSQECQARKKKNTQRESPKVQEAASMSRKVPKRTQVAPSIKDTGSDVEDTSSDNEGTSSDVEYPGPRGSRLGGKRRYVRKRNARGDNAGVCEHGRQQSQCKECGGVGICEHGRRRSQCKECGGSGICEHGRRRSQCKECASGKSAAICKHGRRRNNCKECRGAGICEHGRRRYRCKDCGGVGVCEHGRERSACKDCIGGSICKHRLRRSQCKECGGVGLCVHGRRRYRCKDCGGSGVCPHGRLRSQCKACGGASVCQHGRQRCKCKDCDGVSICEHARERSKCKDCGGASVCEHGRQRSQCKDCRGVSLCEHGCQRSKCKKCGGVGICEHGRERSKCRDCGGPSMCEHGRERSRCKECGGAGICEHGRERPKCTECGGSGICEHGRRRVTCKECGGGNLRV